MPLPEQLGYLGLRHSRSLLADGGNHRLIDRWNLLAEQFFLNGCVWHYGGIVLILPDHGLAFGSQDAHNAERQVANTNGLADRIYSRK